MFRARFLPQIYQHVLLGSARDKAECDLILFWRREIMACSRHVLAPWIVLSAIFAQILTQLYPGRNRQFDFLFLEKGLHSPVRDDSNSNHRQPWHPSASSLPHSLPLWHPGKVACELPGYRNNMGGTCAHPTNQGGYSCCLSRFPQCLSSTFSLCAWEKT